MQPYREGAWGVELPPTPLRPSLTCHAPSLTMPGGRLEGACRLCPHRQQLWSLLTHGFLTHPTEPHARPRKREGTDIQAKQGPLWPEPPMLGVRAPKGGAGLVAAGCGRPRLLRGEMRGSQTGQGLRAHRVTRLPQTSHQNTNSKARGNSAAREAGRRREGQQCPRG